MPPPAMTPACCCLPPMVGQLRARQHLRRSEENARQQNFGEEARVARKQQRKISTEIARLKRGQEESIREQERSVDQVPDHQLFTRNFLTQRKSMLQ